MATRPNPHNRLQAARFPSRRYHRALSAAVLAATAALPARAATDTWTGGTGSWSIGSNWSLGHAPADGDTVSLTRTDAINRTVTLNVSPSFLEGLTIDSTGTGTMALSQSAHSLSVSNVGEYIGYSGTGKYTHTAGTNSTFGSLYLGYNAGSAGIYSLAGTGTLSANGAQYIGYNGSGTLVQSGGKNWASFGPIGIAFAPGSSGSYTLSGGSASANSVYVGGGSDAAGGAGTLTITAAGTLTATGAFKIWDTPGTAVNLAGGFLSVGSLDTSANPSRLNWTAGTLSVTGSGGLTTAVLGPSTTLTPAHALNLAGRSLTLSPTTSLTLDGGSLTLANFVRPNSAGTFTWSSGSLAVTGFSFDPSTLGSTTVLTPARTLTASTLRITGSTLSLTGGPSPPPR